MDRSELAAAIPRCTSVQERRQKPRPEGTPYQLLSERQITSLCVQLQTVVKIPITRPQNLTHPQIETRNTYLKIRLIHNRFSNTKLKQALRLNLEKRMTIKRT